MTRGRIAIIVDDGIICSTEFNGDMYTGENGHGDDVYKALQNINTIDEYKDFVTRFNKENFGYNEYLFFNQCLSSLKFNEDYYDNWFSDYIYIKNLTDKEHSIKQMNKREIVILPNQTKVFYFGNEECMNESAEAKRVLLDKLFSLENDISLPSKTFKNIYDICQKYDEDYDDLGLISFIEDSDFVTDEYVTHFIDDHKDDVNQVKNFLDDVKLDDYFYKINAYGNIRNIDISDVRVFIEELEEHIENGQEKEIENIQNKEMKSQIEQE